MTGLMLLCNLSLAQGWQLLPNCNPSKVNPPWVYLYHFTSAPLLCCHEARHHFKVIFLMSNFTLGYAWVEHIRAAIILNTCFGRYFFLSLCAFILRWWSANEQTARCILTMVLWGCLKGLLSVTLLCLTQLEGKQGKVSSWGTNEPHHQVYQLILRD